MKYHADIVPANYNNNRPDADIYYLFENEQRITRKNINNKISYTLACRIKDKLPNEMRTITDIKLIIQRRTFSLDPLYEIYL